MAADRVAVITGAARGIGLACARRFAEDGFRVVVSDIDESHAQSALDALPGADERAVFVRCDVSDRLDVHNMLAETLARFGRVDVLINNAGVVSPGDVLSLEEAAFDRVIAINLKGAFLVSQAVARQMTAQIEADGERLDDVRKRYAIVNMSSVNAVTAMPDQLAYCVSKGGVNQLTRAMALRLASVGVRVNAVAPGSINTDVLRAVLGDEMGTKAIMARTPLQRVGDPDEVAGAAAFLASKDASYITGQILYVDGGRLALNTLVRED